MGGGAVERGGAAAGGRGMERDERGAGVARGSSGRGEAASRGEARCGGGGERRGAGELWRDEPARESVGVVLARAGGEARRGGGVVDEVWSGGGDRDAGVDEAGMWVSADGEE